MKKLLARTSLIAIACIALASCSEKKKAQDGKSESKPTAVQSDPGRDKPALTNSGEAPAAEDPPDTKRAKYKSKQLSTYDKDGDGVFSPEERRAMVDERLDRAFKELDANGDGSLALDELGSSDARMAKRLERRFKTLDADGSGSLDRQELEKLMTGPSLTRPASGGQRAPRNPGGARP
ncbi:MAG: hypothetical protein KJO07_06590 [Deltaproteobacteria bacterium]|nr:hypothetical protein [Deltaproteobacteria bacterium]